VKDWTHYTKSGKMSKTIFLPKWTELLVTLYDTPAEHRYCGKLHRKTGMTARHLRSLITDLEKMNIVNRIESKSKIKPVRLTETGAKLAQLFLEVHHALNLRG